MSDREESPERQENGSNQSNDDRQRGSASPRRSGSRSRSRRRHHSRSKSRSRSRTRRYSKHRRSRSRSTSQKFSRRHSRSRSPREKRSPYESGGSYGRERGGRDAGKYGRESYYRRSHSRSPMSSRRRHQGSRENPPAGRCLGIFGLSIYTQERDLMDVFSKYGPIDDVQIVYDAQTGRSRGFCFVYFKNSDDAKAAKDRCNGIEIDGRKIRVDFSITQRAHTPTPGIYMGKPTYPRYRGSRGGGSGGAAGGGGGGDFYGSRDGGFSNRERSPSPVYRERRRYSRSRSRSYSPRKYSHYY